MAGGKRIKGKSGRKGRQAIKTHIQIAGQTWDSEGKSTKISYGSGSIPGLDISKPKLIYFQQIAINHSLNSSPGISLLVQMLGNKMGGEAASELGNFTVG